MISFNNIGEDWGCPFHEMCKHDADDVFRRFAALGERFGVGVLSAQTLIGVLNGDRNFRDFSLLLLLLPSRRADRLNGTTSLSCL